MRVEDEEGVFNVYKASNLTSQIKDLYMINVIERDKYGVVNPLKISSNYLIEWPKMNLMFPNMIKFEVKRNVDLESANSRGQKRMKIWLPKKSKRVKKYG